MTVYIKETTVKEAVKRSNLVWAKNVKEQTLVDVMWFEELGGDRRSEEFCRILNMETLKNEGYDRMNVLKVPQEREGKLLFTQGLLATLFREDEGVFSTFEQEEWQYFIQDIDEGLASLRDQNPVKIKRALILYETRLEFVNKKLRFKEGQEIKIEVEGNSPYGETATDLRDYNMEVYGSEYATPVSDNFEEDDYEA